jgi:hypothetical protein
LPNRVKVRGGLSSGPAVHAGHFIGAFVPIGHAEGLAGLGFGLRFRIRVVQEHEADQPYHTEDTTHAKGVQNSVDKEFKGEDSVSWGEFKKGAVAPVGN